MGMLEEKVKKYLDKINRENGKIKAFLSINDKVLEQAKAIDSKAKKGKLYGYVFGVKSNINVRNLETNCASLTLKGFKAPYDASVIEKIKAEDGVIIGMLNMDEFACGSSGETSAFGACGNPRAPGKIPGGSSSGSAASVAAGFCDVSLGSDTGGSIRNPSSFCGVVGVKPSYGLVSRYGLIDLSMSLDQIGPVAKNVSDCALVLSVIAGKDERDTISTESEKIKLESVGNTKNMKFLDASKTQGFRRIKVGILRVPGVDKKIQTLVDKKTEEIIKKMKWNSKEINIKHIDLAVQTYYPLVYTEFFSATRRFDGRRYGKKIEDACGKEVLRRILGGSEITKAEYHGAYYKKALEVKEVIKEEFENVFKDFDCVVLPTCPGLPWNLGKGEKMNPEEIYAYDALTIPANLAEICAVSVPAGEINGIPVGLQVMCAKGQDSKMLSIAKEFE